MPPFIDLTGKTFGLLTVLRLGDRSNTGQIKWWCCCACGTELQVRGTSLRRGDTSSCGTHYSPSQRSNGRWAGVGDLSGSYWSGLINRAKRKGISVTVTKEQAWDLFVSQQGKCALSNRPLSMELNKDSLPSTASLDRISSERGYEPDNIQWVHKDVNRAKNVYSQVEFIKMCHAVAQTHPLKEVV